MRNFLRPTRVVSLLAVLILVSCDAGKPLSLNIKSDRNNYTVNDKIELQVSLENISNHTFNILLHTVVEHYPFNIEVTAEDGSHLRFLGAEITLDYEDFMFHDLASGETYKTRLSLDEDDENEIIFDFKPGAYQIQLSYRDPKTRLVIDSNRLDIIITQ